MLLFSLHPEGDSVSVRLEGDLDIDSTETVEEKLIPSLDNYKLINLDFQNVRFVDSSGMGLLLNFVESLKERDVAITISNVAEDVMEIFQLIQLPKIIGEEVFI
ncbi:STAS domain-containing protein [Bacillota bacterium Lsc_1132]